MPAELLRNFLEGDDVPGSETEHDLYQRFTPTITLDEVNRAARDLLRAGNQVIAVSTPGIPGNVTPTEAQILAVAGAVKRKVLLPFTDFAVSGPLMSEPPAAAAIVASRTIPEIGVTTWTLANGVHVVLKPTDFLPDQILLAGTSPGGSSLVPDSDYVSAMYATTVAALGGLGPYRASVLNQLLIGKTASASLSINPRTENAFGEASWKDAETMFQLLYLRFTAPRKDSSAFIAFRNSSQAAMANSAANPMKAFSDTVTVTLNQHSIRARPTSPATLDEIDLDRALAIYRDRFADASDFTFVIVGSFDLDSIRPLVQRYLGNLPSLKRKEAGRDLGIRPPRGMVDKTVRRGVEQQSQTFIAFTGPYRYSRTNAYLLSSLSEVLTNRLSERLRNKLGGTYGVSARVSGSRDAPHVYLATVSFGSAPARAGELTVPFLRRCRR